MSEIGERLKEARIEQGYTLDDLQQMTKIQKRYLQAIEDGNTDILPGRFYERAFIKQYADIVGLDGEGLLEDTGEKNSKEASEELAESVNMAPTRSTQAKQKGFFSELTNHLPTILIFLLVAAIFVIIYIAFRQTDGLNGNENSLINEETTEQAEPPVSEETNEETEPDADTDQAASDETDDMAEDTDENTEESEDVPADEPTDEPEEQTISIAESNGTDTTYEIAGPHPEEQTLELAANGGDSWVSITVDGAQVEAGLIPSGDTMDTTFGSDTSEVVIVVGNAAVTEVSLNGSAVEYAPESAGIVRQDLTLEFTESLDD